MGRPRGLGSAVARSPRHRAKPKLGCGRDDGKVARSRLGGSPCSGVKIFLLASLCGVLWGHMAWAAEPRLEISLPQAVQLALSRAPAVQVARAAADEAATEPGVAGMWPNPQLTVGSNVNSARGYANLLFPLPILGQRGAAIELAEAVSTVAVQAKHVTQNDTVLGTRVAWLNLWQAEQEAALQEKTRQRRERLLEMTQARWQTGSAAQLEVFRTRTELARATAEAQATAAQVDGKAAGLAAWLLPDNELTSLRTSGDPDLPGDTASALHTPADSNTPKIRPLQRMLPPICTPTTIQ